jgi:hypothetical protein
VENYRLARVLLTEARARRIAGAHGFWFLLNAAARARRRAPTETRTPVQPGLF